MDGWKGVVDCVYRVPEVIRLKLIFSTRWLLALASSDDSKQHIDRIAHEEQLCQRLSGGLTTIADFFDSGWTARYTIGIQHSNTESIRGEDSMSCPELRPATLAQELERREEKRTISDLRLSHAARRTTSIGPIIFQINLFHWQTEVVNSTGPLLTPKDLDIVISDKLFNASGIMESRAATRLGENVKVLTFVSIFFKPLSYCMSVWSINDRGFSLRSLEIVATVVGLPTYLKVFNLDSLMKFSRALYRKSFIFAISMMKTEASDAAWGKRAFILGKFSVQREIERKPSDWRLVQYVLYRALGTIGILGKSTALFNYTKQRLSLATLKSMEKARNPIWIDRAQRFEDAWAKNKYGQVI
ncbi:hypothetical protein BOTCAL_0417g00090 [Botryotinia calthae]|uniref:Uncharacterized protein n=1 Tax=Botryotinia calthae TaxID=38488 RepID=A0A4Y8CRT8_9HELO|nr:hypothetical protein BOTCAL_0417g00090 [Botryotinia calthae]